jgi:hypothetical protein
MSNWQTDYLILLGRAVLSINEKLGKMTMGLTPEQLVEFSKMREDLTELKTAVEDLRSALRTVGGTVEDLSETVTALQRSTPPATPPVDLPDIGGLGQG